MSKNKLAVMKFKPSIKLSIICAILFTLCIGLGLWQIQRGLYKSSLQTKVANTSSLPEAFVQIVNPSLETHRFNTVSVSAVFLDKYTFLLDNQVYKHTAGYRVITVAQSPLLEKWILIDRGWVPVGKDRKTLPMIKNTFGLHDIVGMINTIPTGITLKDDVLQDHPHWPLVIQKLDYGYIAQQLQHPVYTFLIQLQENDPACFTYIPTKFNTPSSKHFGYALQWFSFAVLLVIYYLIVSRKSLD